MSQAPASLTLMNYSDDDDDFDDGTGARFFGKDPPLVTSSKTGARLVGDDTQLVSNLPTADPVNDGTGARFIGKDPTSVSSLKTDPQFIGKDPDSDDVDDDSVDGSFPLVAEHGKSDTMEETPFSQKCDDEHVTEFKSNENNIAIDIRMVADGTSTGGILQKTPSPNSDDVIKIASSGNNEDVIKITSSGNNDDIIKIASSGNNDDVIKMASSSSNMAEHTAGDIAGAPQSMSLSSSSLKRHASSAFDDEDREVESSSPGPPKKQITSSTDTCRPSLSTPATTTVNKHCDQAHTALPPSPLQQQPQAQSIHDMEERSQSAEQDPSSTASPDIPSPGGGGGVSAETQQERQHGHDDESGACTAAAKGAYFPQAQNAGSTATLDPPTLDTPVKFDVTPPTDKKQSMKSIQKVDPASAAVFKSSFHSVTLSIPEEERRLKEEEYRRQVAAARNRGKSSNKMAATDGDRSDRYSTTNKGSTTKSKLYAHGSSAPPPPPKALMAGGSSISKAPYGPSSSQSLNYNQQIDTSEPSSYKQAKPLRSDTRSQDASYNPGIASSANPSSIYNDQGAQLSDTHKSGNKTPSSLMAVLNNALNMKPSAPTSAPEQQQPEDTSYSAMTDPMSSQATQPKLPTDKLFQTKTNLKTRVTKGPSRELTGTGNFNVAGFVSAFNENEQWQYGIRSRKDRRRLIRQYGKMAAKSGGDTGAGFRSHLHSTITPEARQRAKAEYEQRIAMSRPASSRGHAASFSTTNKGKSTKSQLYTGGNSSTDGKPPPPPKSLLSLDTQQAPMASSSGYGPGTAFGSGWQSNKAFGKSNKSNASHKTQGHGQGNTQAFGHSRASRDFGSGQYGSSIASESDSKAFGKSDQSYHGSYQSDQSYKGFGQNEGSNSSDYMEVNMDSQPQPSSIQSHNNAKNNKNRNASTTKSRKRKKQPGFRGELNVTEEEWSRAEAEYKAQIARSRGGGNAGASSADLTGQNSSSSSSFSVTNKGQSTKSQLYGKAGNKPPPPPKALVAGGASVAPLEERPSGGYRNYSESSLHHVPYTHGESRVTQQLGGGALTSNPPSLAAASYSIGGGSLGGNKTGSSQIMDQSYTSTRHSNQNTTSTPVIQTSHMPQSSKHPQSAPVPPPQPPSSNKNPNTPPSKSSSKSKSSKPKSSKSKSAPFHSSTQSHVSAERRKELEQQYKKQIALARAAAAAGSNPNSSKNEEDYSTTNKGTTTKSKLYNHGSTGPPPPPKAIVNQRE